ncbi:MAG: DUF3857 domain-containing protein, partial [Proteobacteria bacterium]
MRSKFTFCTLLFVVLTWAQKVTYNAIDIPANLTENANAVLREQSISVEISSRKSMTITTRRVVTVLNEYGLEKINAIEYYNLRSVSATVYNAFGVEEK